MSFADSERSSNQTLPVIGHVPDGHGSLTSRITTPSLFSGTLKSARKPVQLVADWIGALRPRLFPSAASATSQATGPVSSARENPVSEYALPDSTATVCESCRIADACELLN